MANLSSKIQGVSQAAQAVVTPWQSYSPTALVSLGGSNLGLSATSLLQWRRVGDTMHIQGYVMKDAVGGTGSNAVGIPLPTGYVIDFTKCNNSVAMEFKVGSAQTYGISTASQYDRETQAFVRSSATFSTSAFYLTQPGSGATYVANGILANSVIYVQVEIPISGWESGTLQTANTYQVEYAYNTSGITAAGASDTTSFGYGAGGATIGAIASTTTTASNTSMRVRFRQSVGPTDKVELEVSADNGATWRSTTDSGVGRLAQNTARYGVSISPVAGSTTDYDVIFGNAGANSAAAYASAGTAWPGPVTHWRLKVTRGGIQGFGNATTTTPGLVTLNQLCPTTEWQTYTATVYNDSSSISASASAGYWRRVGDTMEIQMDLRPGSQSGAGFLNISLPSGYTIDAAKTSTAGAGNSNWGTWSAWLSSTQQTNQGMVTNNIASPHRLYFAETSDKTSSGILLTPANMSGTEMKIRASVPIAEWAGSLPGLVSDAQVEFAYNTTTWGNADGGSANYATGSSGGSITGPLTTERSYIVQFANTIQATDQITLEFSENGTVWLPLGQFRGSSGGGVEQYDEAASGTSTAGASVVYQAANQVKVIFGRYSMNEGTANLNWVSGWKWRVKKVKSSISALVDNATASSYGLVKGGKVPGATDGVAIAAGNVGELLENNRAANLNLSAGVVCSVDSGNVTLNDGNEVGITLTPGEWDVQAYVFFVGGAGCSATDLQAWIGTGKGTTSTYQANDSKQAARYNAAFSAPVRWTATTPTLAVRVPSGSTLTLYTKAIATFTGGILGVSGNIRARRVA